MCSSDLLINLDFARADLPEPLEGGTATDILVRLKELPESGRYRLKFDLVSEGVEWFEKCGSPTTEQPLWVLWARDCRFDSAVLWPPRGADIFHGRPNICFDCDDRGHRRCLAFVEHVERASRRSAEFLDHVGVDHRAAPRRSRDP